MYSKTTIIGHLGRAPEMRYTSEGQACTHVSVAVDQGYGDKKITVWYRVTFWGKTAEAVNQYCDKGDIILVEGTIRPPQIWKGQDGTVHTSLELAATACKFIRTKRYEQQNEQAVPEVAREQSEDLFE